MSLTGDDPGLTVDPMDALYMAVGTLSDTLQQGWSGDDLMNELFQIGMLASDAGCEGVAAACMSAAEQVAVVGGGLDAAAAAPALNEHVQLLPLLLADAVASVDVGGAVLASSLAGLRHWSANLLVCAAQPTLGTADAAAFAGVDTSTLDLDLGEPAAAAIEPEVGGEVNAEGIADTDAGGAAQEVGRDMLAVLIEELDAVEQQVMQSAAVIREQAGDARNDEVLALAEFFERLGGACGGIGLTGLQAFLNALTPGLTLAFVERGDADAGDLLDALARAVPPLRAYCEQPDSADAALGLLEVLAEPCWGVLESGVDIEAITAGLTAVTLVEGSAMASMPARAVIATAAEMSLTPPADINAELLDGLLQELPIQTAAFTTAIGQIASGAGTARDIDIAKRAAHTLKGAANTVGIPGIANLTHHLEDILIALGEAGKMPDDAMAGLLVEAGDCLEGMNEAMQGQAPAPADRLAVMQRVLDLANHIDVNGIGAGMPAASTAPPAAAMAEATPAADGDAAAVTQMVRVPAELLEALLRSASEAIVSTARMRDQLMRALDQGRGLRAQSQSLQELLGELEHLVDIRGMGMASVAAENELDSLEFEEFNELHTLSRQLTEAATDAREFGKEVDRHLDDMREAMELHHKIQSAMHESVLQTRMSPVNTIVARLQRSVRQTSRLLDKDVELEVVGADTLMDGNVLQALADPLMHVLRNSIDHGLEDAGGRVAAGKPVQGRITLGFAREGNSIVVRCRDDGKGLDHVAIRHRAETLGLVSPQQDMSPEEISRLILRHGFSTRDEASQISGRGIGMDAVLSSVSELKGTLLLHSDPGQGLTVELRLPVSLVASHAMLVESQTARLAVSTGGIQDLVYLSQTDVREDEHGALFARIGERELPLTDLESLLALPNDRRHEPRSGYPVMLVQLDTGALRAVRVGKVLENRDIVMADLGRFVPRRDGILGATVLGDGTVAPVVDLRELASGGEGILAWNRSHAAAIASVDVELHQRTALVVDDSVSARRSTAQFVRDLGFEVRTAIDGLDAIGILDKWVPDIVLTDMEMPRINGLELSAHIRSREQVKHVPVVMITSRSTEKHRQMATGAGVTSYFVKPFKDQDLADTINELVTA